MKAEVMPIDDLISLLASMPSDPLIQASHEITALRARNVELEVCLRGIILIANGENQVANDDTEALEVIATKARTVTSGLLETRHGESPNQQRNE